jgi:signal transduction histidine kinase
MGHLLGKQGKGSWPRANITLTYSEIPLRYITRSDLIQSMYVPVPLRWASGARWRPQVLLSIAGFLTLSLVVVVALLHWHNISQAQWLIAVGAACAVMVCSAALSVLLIFAERPLDELMAATQRAYRGDLSVRVSFAARDDAIGQLGEQFNNLLSRLERSEWELEELHRLESMRTASFASLGELAAGLTHEIRNPLAGIAGVLEVMANDLSPDSASRAVLGDVHGEIQKIQNLLNDLLLYARPRLPVFHVLDLNATVEQAVVSAKQQCCGKTIGIAFEPSLQVPKVAHDAALLQLALTNILCNAVRGTSGEGNITIRLLQKDSRVAVEICDTGIDLTEEALARIFKPFFSTKREGTGLGLALANGIAQAHGGRIDVHSTKGKGLQFKVWLPIEQGAKKPPRIWRG